MIKRIVCVPVAVAALMVTGVAAANAALPDADRKFVRAAAQGGMTEVALGRVAMRRGASAAVRRFGHHMVTDHSRANRELARLARRKGVALPRDVGAEHQAIIARLSRLSGAAFDRAYAQDMVEDHEEDVAEFRREAGHAVDADVKAFAAKTLPTLQEHLRMAQDIDAKTHGHKR